MTETPFEQLIEERQFAGALQTQAEVFFRLSNTLLSRRASSWNKKHYNQLINEANELETFLDDYGARYNRAYAFLTELVASLRGLAQVAYSIAHLAGRIQSYGVGVVRAGTVHDGVLDSVEKVRGFAGRAIRTLLEATLEEAGHLGLEITPQAFPEENFLPVVARQRLPRNVGEEVIGAEEQKIAEVASKFLQACDMFRQMNLRRLEDAEGRRRLLSQVCTEEQARVYEATVHNLQSAYDTYIKNTVLESENEQLPPLRGFASVALHLLQAVTGLTHFYERHENDIRSQAAKTRIAELVDRAEVQDVILNHLLYWAKHFMESARSVAEGLVRRYTNLQELEVELDDDLALHARPAALIVGIANHYGTPVELEVAGRRCNAGSILDLLVTIGSHPDERRFVFRGDVNPLHDIGLLFQYGLGENGIDRLPDKLSYLRNVQ